MKFKLLLLFFLSILITTQTFASSESEEKEVDRENKGLMKRELEIESKRESKINVSTPKEKVNLLKVYKEENSLPEKELRKNEFGNQRPCNQTLSMMENRIETMDENLQKRRSLRDKIKNNLTVRIQSLKDAGAETSSVEASLNKYLTETENLLKQREGLIMVLADLTRFDCGGDPVNFKNNLKDFNQRFKNQNLEFNRLNKNLRLDVFYQINSLVEKLKTTAQETKEKEVENE